MAECPDGRTNRGTRSQFRIGLPGVGLCKGFYPISLGKIMDAGQSTQISSSSSSPTSRDLISPFNGTHTLTVREYEQTIDELKKENFNLKLKLYLCDETHKKTCRDKDSTAPDDVVQVVVHLTSETESLRAELKDKDKLLQDALEKTEKLESEFKELEKLNADLQSELASFSELPSKEEISLLLEEKENCMNHIESLENIIKEKEEEISTLNEKIEIVANQNTLLDEKIKKRSLAIQGFVYKNYKEKEMLPDEFRNIVISAIQAAKKKNKDELVVATKTFTSALNEIMSASELSLNQSEEKENIRSPSTMCLKEETLEKSASSFLSSQTVSPSHIAQIQSLKEVLSERNMPDIKQTKKLDSVGHHSYIRGKEIHQNAVNIAEIDFIEPCDISSSTEKNLILFSEKSDLQTCSVTEHNLINIESGSSSPVVSKLMPEKDISESDQLVHILNENEQLKHDLQKKLSVIEDLRAACKESKGIHLEKNKSDAFKASQQYCVSTQTERSGCNLLNEDEIIKLQKDAKLSNNVEELREDILLLLHTIEEKNKELSEVKQSLAFVQEDLKKVLNTTNIAEKDFYLQERNELHERLALSCSVNEELMKHLKNLERFMEDLLQNKFDSTLESITDKSDFMSSVSRCLNESLKFSRILSDHLSVCEGSKLFEECESFAYKNGSHSEEKDLPYLGLDRLSMQEQLPSFSEYISYTRKNSLKIGKESDSSQLCWRCWQQMNPPLNQLEVSHLIQNNIIPKSVVYQSSDSDIWSEPDRNVSMQRIGISLQNSPVSSKSPRKLRQKDKRISCRTSSKENTSSSDCQQACKKRQASVSRRLFAKDNAKAQDFALEKIYFLVAEKFTKLKSLLDELEESMQDGSLSNEEWITLNKLVMAVGETFQTLHSVKENAKISPSCGKCVMLDLFSTIKSYHAEESSLTTEHKILQEFARELCLLKEACKEPFSIFHESVDKKSVSSESDILIEGEQIKKLQSIIDDLNAKNNELNQNLENAKYLLSKEKDALVSIKTEKFNLLTEIDNLKINFLDMKYKVKELSCKNEKLANESACLSKKNLELNSTLKDLEQKQKESTIELEQLTAELSKNRLDLINVNEKCLEYEKQLNEQMHIRENSENKLKNLECESLSEKNYYLRKIDDLNAEKDHNVQELKTVQEKILALEKENAIINDRLQSKNSELLSLKETIEKLQSIKDTQNDLENGIACREKIVLESIKTENFKLLSEVNHLKEDLLDMKYKDKELSFENKKLMEELDQINKNYSELNRTLKDLKQKMEESCSTADTLKAELQKNRLDLAHMNEKCLSYEKQLDEQVQVKEKYESELKTLELKSLTEKENYLNQLDVLNAEKNQYEEELKNIQQKMLALEKENAIINSSFRSKNDSLLSLQKTIENFQNDKEAVISEHEDANRLFSKVKESSESIKIENNKLSNKINQLEEELSHVKNKEKELYHKNEILFEKLTCVSKKNSEFNSTLNDLEQKRKESSIELKQLTAELQKKKSDLIHVNEKCLEYESKLKNLESESLSEKNYYLRKIDDLNAEKNHNVQELKAVQEKILALEKENAIINDRLQSKNNELFSLKETLEKLQSIKDTQNDVENGIACKQIILLESIKSENVRLLSQVDLLKEELLNIKYKEKETSLENKKLIEELDQINKNYSELNNTLIDLKQKKEESCSAADTLKAELQKNRLDLAYMKEKYESELKTLELNSLNEKNHCEQELKNTQEKLLVLEKENVAVNSSLKSKNYELSSLQKTIENLENAKKAVNSEHEIAKRLLVEGKELSESFKIENHKLSSRINQLEEEVSHMKNKEKKCCLENEKLIEELNKVNKSNSKQKNTLKVQEQKIKDSNVELDRMRSELEKNKSDLVNLSEKCRAYEKQLSEQFQMKEKLEYELKTQESHSLNEQKNFLNQIHALNAEKDTFLQELKSVRENKLNLENEIKDINDRLQSKSNELNTLEKTIEELQWELENNRECLTNLQEKCKEREEIILKFKESKSDYCQQLKQCQIESVTEKEKLLNEISVLTKEKEDILQKLKHEKERYKRLKAENIELNENYLKSSQQVTTLKQRNEFFENALLSSNKECDALSKDLKCLRNTLQNLESKCLSYEKQLTAAAGMKDNLIECLLNINNEFSVQKQKINETCKIYGNDNSVVQDENSSKFIPLIDDDNVPKLCENIVCETKKLSQSVDILFSTLKSYHLKSIEAETFEEKIQTKNQNLKKQMEFYKNKVESLRLQKDQLQNLIDELQKSLSEKEKSIQHNSREIQTLKEKVPSSQKEIDRINELIHRKDDEITMLQERIFNLQTYINTLMTDKKNMLEKTTSMTEKPDDSIFSSNQLPSKIVLTNTKMCQTDECEDTTQNVDESFTSVSSLEAGKNRCCEKYWKKCYSLQTKLALSRKHAEILEKDKNDLKERFLQQLQSKKDSAGSSGSAVSKLVELESKLEKKKLFIGELKSELCKTCNALIDKEKEIDDLKQKLADCKVNTKDETIDRSKKQPTATFSSVDGNVKTLKSHKWRLIQNIFDIQRKFYEKKGIHLNYFDKFREHVNNLYSLRLIPSMSKSESMPLLRSYALKEKYEQGTEKMKKIADLELDIECLQNLKIFLNRFLIPCVFPISEKSDKQAEIQLAELSSERLSLPIEKESEKESKQEITDILNLPFPEAFIMTDKEKKLSIDGVAWTISQHLDCIEQFFEAVTKRNWLEILEVEGSVNEAEAKSVLLKIIQEINVLHEKAVNLFHLNVHLKSFDVVASLQASLSTSKLDASDRESVMSEETIAVSRTESPMSLEDICPIKLPHPETLELEERTLKLGSDENKVTVIEPYSTKVTVIDGSCDSVCQRSHYSSPDLGIESDPNHDSSAPEHKDDGTNKYQRFSLKPQPKTAFTNAESAGRWPGPKFGETFYAVGTLPHYELLRQEIKECLVAIKSVLSRTGDGLHHIVKYTSPRKTLEYNTLKSIKDTCIHMDVCLKEANNLIGKFWTAPCPTEKEWKILKEENEKLSEELRCLKSMIDKQEIEFKTAMGKLQNAQAVKDSMEKKISKKLVKTKKLIRQAELKLLETRCQNFPPVPKYPSEQIEQTDTRRNAH